jgi:protein-disulfide isomerase
VESPAVWPALAALCALVWTGPVAAQDTEDLRSEIEALKAEQQEIRGELAELRALVEDRAQPQLDSASDVGVAGVVFDLGDTPVRGEPDAPLILVEFTDYQCGYCASYHQQTYRRIQATYVASGKLRYAVLDLPIPQLHRLAFKAAEVSRCAAEQGKFWEMHDRLFEQQANLEAWDRHAEAVGLDLKAFDECLRTARPAETVRSGQIQAAKAGASGTPTFVLARSTPGQPGRVVGVARLRGAKPFAAFQVMIERALAASP